MVFLRVLIEGRDAGRQASPYMTEIDTGTDGRLHAIFLSFILIAVLQALFGWEHLRHVAPVRESIGDVPLHIRLLHITERIALEILVLMNEHTLFEGGKVLVRLGIFVPHHRSLAVEVLRATPQPSAFGQSQHARIEVVFEHHVLFRREQTVVPQGHDSTHHIVGLMRLVIHLAVIQCHHIGKGIEMVGIMETAIDVRDARCHLSVEAPHLNHVDFTRLVSPSRIPRNHLLASFTDEGHHLGHECRIREAHFVRSDMQIRHIRKGLAHLVDEEFQNLRTFGALHVMTEGTLEGRAVSRHIHFGDEEHVVRLAERHEFLGLLDGVILALQTSHVHTVVQHRENLAFQSPCLVFGQVPMKDIDFISGEDFDFLLQLVHREIATADVMHESTNLEGRPVHYLARLEAALLLLQLTECLQCPVHTLLGSRFDSDALTGDLQPISFFLIHLGTNDFRHQLHFDFSG